MLKDALERIGRTVTAHPRIALLVLALSLIAAVQGAGQMGFESGGNTFAGEDTDVYQAYDTYSDAFEEETIILLVESHDVASPSELRALQRFDDTATSITGVEDVRSLTDLAAPNGDVPNTRDAVDNRLVAAPDAELRSVMPDDRRSIAIITLERGLTGTQEEKILASLETAAKWSDFPPGTSTTLTGSTVFGMQMRTAMQQDLKTMFGAAILLMVLALGLLFRNVSFRYLPLLIVLVSVFWTFGTMGFLGIPMTMASMAIFPILIGVGIDYAVHFQHRVQEEIERGNPNPIPAAYRGIGPAVLKALTTTALGFTAMLLFPVPMVQGFGLMSLIGVLAAYLAVLLLLGPTYHLLTTHWPTNRLPSLSPSPPSLSLPRVSLDDAVARLMTTSARRPALVLGVAAILTVGGFASSTQVGVQVEETELVPQDLPALLDLEHMNTFLDGGSTLAVVATGDVTDPETLRWMRDFGTYATDSNEDVVVATSIATELAAQNGGQLPETEAEVETLLTTMPEEKRDRYLDDGTRAAVKLEYPTELTMRQFMALSDAVERDLAWVPPPPGISTTITSGDTLVMSAFRVIEKGKTLLSLLAFAIIFLGLTLLFRSPLRALTPLIPITFVVGWNGGAMFLTGTDYTPLTATLGALSIGLGADYSMLVMEHYLEERRNGVPPVEALENTGSSTGRAITVSASTTLFGFSALMAASFPLLQNFGRITIITVILALIAAFVTLPPLLLALDPWLTRTHATKIRDRLPSLPHPLKRT